MASKPKSTVIALDAMGGDYAPDAALEGALLALEKKPDLTFLIFGDESEVMPRLRKLPKLMAASEFVHAPEVVSSHMNPATALRTLKNSSMRLSINAVKEGRAQAVVSAGNTGAYLATSKFVLHTIEGIRRPALAALLPTGDEKRDSLMLDLGANVEATAEHLVQFAIMGTVYARQVMKIQTPRVALLNIGSEDNKGLPLIHKTADILKTILNYTGYVEGNDLLKGKADVVVCDGFSGNVALKSMEGAVSFVGDLIKHNLGKKWWNKILLLCAMPLLVQLKKHLDPDRYNGALFLGLNGIAVKAHGNSKSTGLCQAILKSDQLVAHKFNDEISREIQNSPYRSA